jgi:hypothetical protein
MSFKGINGLRAADEVINYEEWQLKEMIKCYEDPIYFIKNYVKINMKDKGVQLFDLYPFQEELIGTFEAERFTICKFPRQCGKSATTRAFILWYMIFNKQKVIAILANKLALAQEQLTQLKDSYLELPMWMQPGVTSWNKRGLELAHGTRVLAAATSPDGIRGYSIDILYLDEFAFIDAHIADEFIASVFPVVSSGTTTKIIITSTPSGHNHFYSMWMKAKEKRSNFKAVEIPWNAVPGRTTEWANEQRALIGEIRFNQEFLCSFIGSVSTLIDANYLTSIKAIEPLKVPSLPKEMKVWELPVHPDKLRVNDWEYVASLDTSMGVHADYSVMQFFLVKSNVECIQVAMMSSNKLGITDFCTKSLLLLKAYHKPNLIIEQNGIGQSSIDFFVSKEYDNMMHFDPKVRNLGLVSSGPLKGMACDIFKTYIQKNLMTIRDETTIKEMLSFGRKGKSWEGLSGAHDDHILPCIWTAYYLISPLFYGNVIEEDVSTLPDDAVIIKAFGYDGEDAEVIKQVRDYEVYEKLHSDAGKYADDSNNAEYEEDDGSGAGLIVRG